MQIQTKKIFVNGVELNYIEQGKGEPVVFVHGSLGDFRAWDFQMEPFSKRYHAIAYSQRYHYPNAWMGTVSDYSAILHAEDLAALITALKLEAVHVVALSYGAYIALFFAIKHPDLVRTLVLGEPAILLWLNDIPEGKSLLTEFNTHIMEPLRQAFQHGDMEQGLKKFIDGINGKGSFDLLPQAYRGRIMDNAPAMKAQLYAPEQVLFPTFTCKDARKIHKPTLLLVGELSPKMFHLIIDELERCMVNKERTIIHDASHSMHYGNPKVFNEIVLTFLAKN